MTARMLQVNVRDNNTFDAVVVGSGATGGMAAKELTEAGLNVAVLEAGPPHNEADYTEHLQPYQYKYRNSTNPKAPGVRQMQPMQSETYACLEGNHKWFVDDIKNPYETAEGKPFRWIRCRVVGGRSLTWGRQSYRHGDIDFKAASRDGYGIDWPISAEDLEPYYRKVERYVGISGKEEGLPQLPDSIFMPPMGLTCGEARFRERLKDKMGRVATIGRTAILTQAHNGRAACHYCGPCQNGCITHSYYASPTTTLKTAEATGRLTLIPNAPVSHVTKDKRTGLANGVVYVDAETRQSKEIRAKVVVLCASTLESTRILLNSEPGGMANSSGALGHYLMDHIFQGGARGEADGLPIKPWSGAPRRPTGMYVPRFRNIDRSHTNGFIRGYGYQGGSSCSFNTGASGFGAKYKQAVHDEAGWHTNLGAWCECLPRYENYVELNHDKKDAYGIPTLKIHMAWSDNEYALWNDAREQAAEMLEATGHKNVRLTGAPSAPGFCIHEVGTARMSENPRQGVLNGYAQAHDVKNLFVTDGAAWTTIACQNPTLTMMAITARTCDYIQDQLKKGQLA